MSEDETSLQKIQENQYNHSQKVKEKRLLAIQIIQTHHSSEHSEQSV
jgi:hypothetical protein